VSVAQLYLQLILVVQQTPGGYAEQGKKAEDGIAQGSKVGYDPNTKDTKGEKERTPRVGLAHELKHSSDIDKGEMDMETKTETGVPVKEVDAIYTENKIREKNWR
jgi:hypothetical protein